MYHQDKSTQESWRAADNDVESSDTGRTGLS
jgi:hypothetical protein